ncbi:hypothetical protein [Clostridium saccharobutylicum]|uniref:Uncharacterized protein n=1 Tax=Clostridium saccharobutylicum DSM 13864 TaxID=1345695 RepID=U5MVF7_CLOSA|nr:hypothetical protein [Clostridium saccharobutylicum]AGX44513.1 hypothetical protein CLSA_c35520 [Clostridium saccharobutylicum DSM 13864]AQR91806.1 hypothetical protein CLOSC_35340 [Clostridium saccharobutylicum]AQS01708.1 hypothetical protein CSACC_35390 [Clostridium saccharobutylicum]AQS15691.1 hypothetical protein CLOSACC_35390 [Clostridium saccharobutylicum]MBA2907468.1 hypothetical protein [Clostridium saccharobutylicum]
MRAGIRQYLIDKVLEFNNCYEPNVATKDTIKPYAVIVQGSDEDNGSVVGFKRTIEIWVYENRTTFKNLDSLTEKVIKALDMQVISDVKTNETFTCIYDGAIGKDVVDENWNIISRGVKFTVIALHEEDEINTDPWLDALRDYTKGITNNTVYLNNWKKNLNVPSILWRVKNQSKERENNSLIKESKTLICHIASNNKNEINKLLDDIENKFITDLKIPLDLKDKRYLTIESISEDREADMLSKGQLIVKLFRRKSIKINENSTINKIKGRGILKED